MSTLKELCAERDMLSARNPTVDQARVAGFDETRMQAVFQMEDRISGLDERIAVAEQRPTRLQNIIDGYEADGPDFSVPGTVEGEQFVVITESTRGHGYFVNVTDRAGVSDVAVENIHEGWRPVCYFDLDVLAGDKPNIAERDVVDLDGQRHIVVRVDEELIEGEVGLFACLIAEDNMAGRTTGDIDWDEWDQREHQDDLSIVERADPDERMPVRYGLAKIVTIAVFNTIPSP